MKNRTAINTSMQGSAADRLKLLMFNTATELTKNGTGITMVLQVHDDLVFEVSEEKLDKEVI